MWHVRHPGAKGTPGADREFLFFCVERRDLALIAFWKWDDAGRPKPFSFCVDLFETRRDLHAAYIQNYEQFERALTGAAPGVMSHRAGELPVGGNMRLAAMMAAADAADGWFDHKTANTCLTEVMVVRPGDRLRADRSETVDLGEFLAAEAA